MPYINAVLACAKMRLEVEGLKSGKKTPWVLGVAGHQVRVSEKKYLEALFPEEGWLP